MKTLLVSMSTVPRSRPGTEVSRRSDLGLLSEMSIVRIPDDYFLVPERRFTVPQSQSQSSLLPTLQRRYSGSSVAKTLLFFISVSGSQRQETQPHNIIIIGIQFIFKLGVFLMKILVCKYLFHGRPSDPCRSANLGLPCRPGTVGQCRARGVHSSGLSGDQGDPPLGDGGCPTRRCHPFSGPQLWATVSTPEVLKGPRRHCKGMCHRILSDVSERTLKPPVFRFRPDVRRRMVLDLPS